MAVISESDGSVSNRYKSSTNFDNIYGSAISGDYIAASIVYSSAYYILIFNIATNAFIIKSFSGANLYEIGLEPATNRLVVCGYKNQNGYITKFTPQSIFAHPDFQTTATWTMDVLTTGIDDIVLESGQTVGAVVSRSVSLPTYTNLTFTYVQEASYTSEVNYLTNDQSYSILESTTVKKTPDLPCSISGSTSISFSIGSYLTSAPSWVTVDSSTGVLSISAPEVSSDSEYDFYINSAVDGVADPIQKLIKLKILNCSPSNCQK